MTHVFRPNLTLAASLLAFTFASSAFAQKPPQVKEMKPGKYSYSIETNNPAIPFKMPAINFSQCVTQKDLDEGRGLQAQKDSGVECAYSDIKSSPGRYQFKAKCKMKGDITMKADYDMKAKGDGDLEMDIKQEMSGGGMPANMGKSTSKMVMKRTGDC